jgi:ribosomal protein L7/L12
MEDFMGNKFVFAILSIFTNHLGIPAFLQGKKKTGLVRLILTFVTLGICGFINFILGLIQGIQVIMMSNEDFEEQKYVLDKGIPSASMFGEAGDYQSSEESAPSAPRATKQTSSDSYNVLINDCGFDKSAVLQVIIELKDCSLDEALEAADNGIALQDVSEATADHAIKLLQAAGAKVEKEEAYNYDEFSSDNMLGDPDDDMDLELE